MSKNITFRELSKRFLNKEDILLNCPALNFKEGRIVHHRSNTGEKPEHNIDFLGEAKFHNCLCNTAVIRPDDKQTYDLVDLDEYEVTGNSMMSTIGIQKYNIVLPIKLMEKHRISILVFGKSARGGNLYPYELHFMTIPLQLYLSNFKNHYITLYGEKIYKYENFDFKLHKAESNNAELSAIQDSLGLFGDTLDITSLTPVLDCDNNLVNLSDLDKNSKASIKLLNLNGVTSVNTQLVANINTRADIVAYNLSSIDKGYLYTSFSGLNTVFLTNTDLGMLKREYRKGISEAFTQGIVVFREQFISSPDEAIIELLNRLPCESLGRLVIVPDKYRDCSMLELLNIDDCIGISFTREHYEGDDFAGGAICFSTCDPLYTDKNVEEIAYFGLNYTKQDGLVGTRKRSYQFKDNPTLKELVFRVHKLI